MPFVTEEHRKHPDFNIPGDRCFVYYKRMVEAWTACPRWTTAHKLYKEVMICRLAQEPGIPAYVSDGQVALELAWQVFFQKYVMPYEDKKEKDNGTI